MPALFENLTVGRLKLRNRLMRSATAECLADDASGRPMPAADRRSGPAAQVAAGHGRRSCMHALQPVLAQGARPGRACRNATVLRELGR